MLMCKRTVLLALACREAARGPRSLDFQGLALFRVAMGNSKSLGLLGVGIGIFQESSGFRVCGGAAFPC